MNILVYRVVKSEPLPTYGEGNGFVLLAELLHCSRPAVTRNPSILPTVTNLTLRVSLSEYPLPIIGNS